MGWFINLFIFLNHYFRFSTFYQHTKYIHFVQSSQEKTMLWQSWLYFKVKYMKKGWKVLLVQSDNWNWRHVYMKENIKSKNG